MDEEGNGHQRENCCHLLTRNGSKLTLPRSLVKFGKPQSRPDTSRRLGSGPKVNAHPLSKEFTDAIKAGEVKFEFYTVLAASKRHSLSCAHMLPSGSSFQNMCLQQHHSCLHNTCKGACFMLREPVHSSPGPPVDVQPLEPCLKRPWLWQLPKPPEVHTDLGYPQPGELN